MVLENTIYKKERWPLPAVILYGLMVILFQITGIFVAVVFYDDRVQGFDLLFSRSKIWVKIIKISDRLLKFGVKQKLTPCFLTEQLVDAVVSVSIELVSHFVVWSELIFDCIVYPAFTVLILNKLLTESQRPLNKPCINENIWWARILLTHLNMHITFVFLIVESTCSILFFRL